MPIQTPDYAALLERYAKLQRARELEAFCIPTTRKHHTRWMQAERRTRAAERHLLRVERLLHGAAY